MKTYTRSQLNEFKREYGDTINGIVLSRYDILESWGEFDGCNIIEDCKPIEELEREEEERRYEKFKMELC